VQSFLLVVILESDRSHSVVASVRINSASKEYGITPSCCRPRGAEKYEFLELITCMFKHLKPF